jgi:hypothetical protein
MASRGLTWPIKTQPQLKGGKVRKLESNSIRVLCLMMPLLAADSDQQEVVINNVKLQKKWSSYLVLKETQ